MSSSTLAGLLADALVLLAKLDLSDEHDAEALRITTAAMAEVDGREAIRGWIEQRREELEDADRTAGVKASSSGSGIPVHVTRPESTVRAADLGEPARASDERACARCGHPESVHDRILVDPIQGTPPDPSHPFERIVLTALAVGDRVREVHTPGACGAVERIDPDGSIRIRWDDHERRGWEGDELDPWSAAGAARLLTRIEKANVDEPPLEDGSGDLCGFCGTRFDAHARDGCALWDEPKRKESKDG